MDTTTSAGGTFSPGDLAKRLRNRLLERTPGPVPAHWRDRLETVLQTVALEPRLELLDEEPVDHACVRFPSLLREDVQPVQVAAAWVDVLDKGLQVTAAEGLLFEFHASLHGERFAEALPNHYSYVKTLHVIRSRAGIALHDYAREVNWRRPILYVSILKLARLYHRAVVAEQALTAPEHRREFTGRLGVSTVLISRFEDVTQVEAEEACEALSASLRQGNDPGPAQAYLLESLCLRYDINSEREILQEAEALAEAAEDLSSLYPALALARVEVLLRVYDETDSGDRAEELRAKAVDILRRSEHQMGEAEDKVRWTILNVVASSAAARGHAGMRGLRMPFGIRHSGHQDSLAPMRASLIRALSPLTEQGEPLARGIYADLVDQVPAVGNKEIAKFRLLVEMRGGGRRWQPLRDERSQLLCSRDRLNLAALGDDSASRDASLSDLISLCAEPTCATAAMVLLARDVEARGGAVVTSSYGTDLQLWLLEQVRLGNSRDILARAASTALSSPDLSVALLGGRSGVVTVSDYYDVVGGTFVFKSTTVLQWLRELRRSAAIRTALRASELDGLYGVVDHLSPSEEEAADLQPRAVVSTVRRFASGVDLRTYVANSSRAEGQAAAVRAAAFLGHIHRLEDDASTVPVSVRKDVWVKEVGRWLKTLDVPNPSSLFEDYWGHYQGMPNLLRRDAHPLNWLVGQEGKLLAVDLEAVGWRPLTYELAQLSEDGCFLAPSDWDGRRRLLEAYLEAARQPISEESFQAFEASIAARSLRKLTPPTGVGDTLQHGRDVLRELIRRTQSPQLRSWCEQVLGAWQSARGLSNVALNVSLSDSRRRRLSRSMAYHLRHDKSIERDEEGWIELSELATRVKSGPSEQELLLVASDFREPRFEVAEGKVRALYGHSRPAALSHAPAPTASVSLFHSTSLEVAELILRKEGLKPMGRQYVHLSSRMEAARATPRARRSASLLLTVESDHVGDLRHAGEATYVAPKVAAAHLRVVPVSCAQ